MRHFRQFEEVKRIGKRKFYAALCEAAGAREALRRLGFQPDEISVGLSHGFAATGEHIDHLFYVKLEAQKSSFAIAIAEWNKPRAEVIELWNELAEYINNEATDEELAELWRDCVFGSDRKAWEGLLKALRMNGIQPPVTLS